VSYSRETLLRRIFAAKGEAQLRRIAFPSKDWERRAELIPRENQIQADKNKPALARIS
jgi:hypothetical protein